MDQFLRLASWYQWSWRPGLASHPKNKSAAAKPYTPRQERSKNRAAIAFRLGASCLYHAKNYLGALFRRMKF
jgi:hypothetical protein